MWYGGCKVYNDGSHYIAIPHTTRPTKKRPKLPEEVITVVEEIEGSAEIVEPSLSIATTENSTIIEEIDNVEKDIKEIDNTPKMAKKLTKKEYFNELYKENINLKKSERKNKIIKLMLPYFKDHQSCVDFVNVNFDRKQRNLICRRIRMSRKANLADFNYFCTFTYDDKKHTEETFKKKLQGCFKMMCHRRKWKYMGVWERAPKTNRLHFHGLFTIPAGQMVGELIQKNDYSLKTQKRQITTQNTYFNERFGRCDFDEIEPYDKKLGNALAYLMKYIEKTDEKIVYSKGLYQYFISDILEDDIVCPIGMEDKKLLLFDDFMCLDEGCLMGKVSPEVIEQMQKCN